MRTCGGVFTHLSRYDDVSLEPVAARLHFDELCGGSQRGECAVAVRNKTFAGRTGADAAKPPDDAECGGGAAADLPARSSNFTTNEIGKGAGFIAFDAFDRNLRRAKRREILGNLRSSCSTIVEELKQINHRAKCHGVFSISNKTRCFYLLQPAR